MVDNATGQKVDEFLDWQSSVPREREQLSFGGGVYGDVTQVVWDLEDEQTFLFLDISGAQEQAEPIDEKAIEKAVGKAIG